MKEGVWVLIPLVQTGLAAGKYYRSCLEDKRGLNSHVWSSSVRHSPDALRPVTKKVFFDAALSIFVVREQDSLHKEGIVRMKEV